MIRLVRVLGFLMIGAGALLVAAWAIPPLRGLWPWLRQLPWPVQAGLGACAAGLLLLFGSILWERIEDSARDAELRDERVEERT